MKLTIQLDIDEITRTVHCTVDLPRRKSWSTPREPMSVMVDSVEPALGRDLTSAEYEDVYARCKDHIIRSLTCGR